MENNPTEPAEFDMHACGYETDLQASIPGFVSEGDYFSRYKVETVANLQKGIQPKAVLDFGCGVGLTLQLFPEYFPGAGLWGYDVSLASIQYARSRVPAARLIRNLEDLPENFFDVVFVANVFHHIPKNERLATMKMCGNLLAANGRAYIFEHNPYNPLTRRVFENCPFDKGAEMLARRDMLDLVKHAGLRVLDKRYTLFFPRQFAFMRSLEPLLSRLPIGAQYCVVLAK